MGVKDIGPILKKYCPKSFTTIPSLSALAHSTFAIDGNLLTTKFHLVHTAALGAVESNKHIKGWYHLIKALDKQNIGVVVVMDGTSRLEAKRAENEKRDSRRELQRIRGELEHKRHVRLMETRDALAHLEEDSGSGPGGEDQTSLDSSRRKFEEEEREGVPWGLHQKKLVVEESHWWSQLNSGEQNVTALESDTIEQLMRRSETLAAVHTLRGQGVPRRIFAESIKLLRALGIQVIQPTPEEPFEAEGLCCTLHSLGLVDYVVSEDTDVLVYGAPLLRHITTSSFTFKPGRPRKPMHVLQPSKVIDELEMTKEMFLDYCLLCGTDFVERIRNCGPETALKLIREHKTIETILSSQSKYRPTDSAAYLETVRAARKIFLELPPLPVGFEVKPGKKSNDLGRLLRGWGVWQDWDDKHVTGSEEDFLPTPLSEEEPPDDLVERWIERWENDDWDVDNSGFLKDLNQLDLER